MKVRSDQIVILSYVLMSCRVPKIMELRLEFLVTFRTIKSKNHEFIISLCHVIETFLSQVHYMMYLLDYYSVRRLLYLSKSKELLVSGYE